MNNIINNDSEFYGNITISGDINIINNGKLLQDSEEFVGGSDGFPNPVDETLDMSNNDIINVNDLSVNGNIGIGTTSPDYKLDVSGNLNAVTIYENGELLTDKYASTVLLNNYANLNEDNSFNGYNVFNNGIVVGETTQSAALNIKKLPSSSFIFIIEAKNTNDQVVFSVNGDGDVTANSYSPFTGSHICYMDIQNTLIKSDTKNIDSLSTQQGLIVSSTGRVPNIRLNNSFPYVKLTDTPYDKCVYGVLSRIYNHMDGRVEDEKRRELLVNSVGEGGIWVCNINGSLKNGDYITSSSIPGYGMKQDDGLLHNYTVAKITMDCDFTITQRENQSENTYKIRYLDISGVEITKEEYENLLEEPFRKRFNKNEEGSTNTSVYIAAFVGCTYHCG